MLTPSARTLLLGVAALAACGGSASDISELKKGQKDILAKLDSLEKSVQQVKAQPAAAPQRPQLDPNKVYNIPVGDSPVKGPRQAKVTITEFSDFQ
jgi:protein-disulfide isomerase